MNIDRDKICDAFRKYTDNYNPTDTKIKLKIDHTFRVADICDQIARSLKLSEEDINLSWTIGMLHDIGRFEQVRRYNTFSDADSINHACFGADLLFKENLLCTFIDENKVIKDKESGDFTGILEIAIRNHSAYRMEENLSDRCKMFCNIIRDADKVDIVRVNYETPMEEIYNVSTKKLKEASISKEVLEAFYEEHAVLRSLKKTPIDHLVGHISLIYELVYSLSYRLVDEQGYLYKLMNFKSDNQDTNVLLENMKTHMIEYISKKIS